MAQTVFQQQQQADKKKLQFMPHVFLFAVLVAGFFYVFHTIVIPWGFANAVVYLFQPQGEEAMRTEFVHFNDLVWASVKKNKVDEIIPQKTEIKGDFINKQYVFDFTFKERTPEEHGYPKKSSEFIAWAPKLGDEAIILEPHMGFPILSLVLSTLCAALITTLAPTRVGMIALLFDRQVDNTKSKIRLQTGFSQDIVEVLTLPDDKLADLDPGMVERIFRAVWERTVTEELAAAKNFVVFEDVFDENTDWAHFRDNILYGRIKEFFSDFVVKEIEDTKDGLDWRRNHLLVMKGLRLYMAHHFTEKYANNVTGLAYLGAAFLIIAVGIRGLKFIPATKPSFILLAIFLEFTMLSLLGITLIYTEEEERMDKMLKKMEDANRSQLEALRGQQEDIHLLANALVGQTAELIRNRVEAAIQDYLASDNNIEQAVARGMQEKFEEVFKQHYAGTKESGRIGRGR